MYSNIENKLKSLQIENGKVTDVTFIAANTPISFFDTIQLDPLPQHYRVKIHVCAEGKSNIKIEIWLPENWNGRFLAAGNGGGAGAIDVTGLTLGLRSGFATANTDLGTSPDPDGLVNQPERWADFGHRATHIMAVVAKQVIKEFYGKAPEYSYFRGGSTGGQQGLSAAQRYPNDYNGILATAPARDRTHLHMSFIWNYQALTKTENSSFTTEQAKTVTDRILNQYAKEGVRLQGDKFFMRPDKITVDWDGFKDILHGDQIEALKTICMGAVNPKTGERLYAPLYVPGTEDSEFGLAAQSGEAGFLGLMFIIRWVFGKDYDLKSFDFDKDAALLDEKLADYLNANNPDLSEFKKVGGKMIMLHGLADAIIPYTDSLDYYNDMIEKQGSIESTQEFFRYYLVPGLGHVFNGPGVQDITMGVKATPKDREHDALTALVAWVEKDITPERLLPVAFKDRNMFNGLIMDEYEYERPIYPYPNYAEYVSGDKNDKNNYKKINLIDNQN